MALQLLLRDYGWLRLSGALIFPGLLRLWPAVILEDWTDLGPTVDERKTMMCGSYGAFANKTGACE